MTTLPRLLLTLGAVGASLALVVGIVAMIAAWYNRADR